MTRSLFETIAPLAIVGLEGPRLTRSERSLLAKAPPAGIILFARNVESARQLRELTYELERIFLEAKGAPPIIAADHEGGIVSVLARAIGTPPSQMAVGRAMVVPSLVGDCFAETARRLLSCGVNMMLGPVADVNAEYLNPIIGTRSFGEGVETAARCVPEAVAAARGAGILTCLKHFPGHGAARVDSHLALPVLEATLDQLREKDLISFAKGFEAGAECVMVGHVVPMDRTIAASLDPGIVTSVLRGELHFDGVAMTDALEMAGVRVADRRLEGEGAGVGEACGPRKSLAEICELALRAGNDIVLFSKPVAEIVEELDASSAAQAGSDFWGAEFAEHTRAARTRINRLVALISQRDIRTGERKFDDEVYWHVATWSYRIAQNPGSFETSNRESGFNVVFWSERGMFERPPVETFITRVLNELRYGGGDGSQVSKKRPLRPSKYMAARRKEISVMYPALESVAFSCGKNAKAAPGIVFLMNRSPLEPAAVKDICSGADAVVVAEWPYAASFIDPGRLVIVTYGIYEAAAEAACRLLLTALYRRAESR